MVVEFNFFQGIYVRIDIKFDIFISVGLMSTRFGNQTHLQDLIQMTLIRQALVMSLRQDHVTN